ncbi:MAG: hypothetical protein AB1638_06185 [Nitrospirota bacterium]
MRRSLLIFLILLFLGIAVKSMAELPDDFDEPPTREQMGKVRERIETLRIWKLTKALDLDDRTSAQLFPVLNRYDKKRVEIEHALWSGMRELKESLKGKREGQLKGIIERLEADHKALQRINDSEREELKKILTVEQQAKFILFQQKFNREIKKIIAEARERRLERFKERR